MKRILCLCLSLLAVAGLLISCNETPQNYSEGLKFTSNGDGTCYVSGIGKCKDTDIVIPKTSPRGDEVIGIGNNAFYSCRTLKRITIPEGVTSIGNFAFYECVDLANITIPSSVKSIGYVAFYSCANLQSITIPEGIKSIGDYTFHECMSLTNITIPDGVTDIGNEAFRYCAHLAVVTIPTSVTNIGEYAFADCASLATIIFQGTDKQWEVIKKGGNWHSDSESFTVTFTQK